MLPYFDLPFDHSESLPEGDYLLVTYLAFGLTASGALRRAGNFATGQTIGTWLPLPGVTRAMIENYQARVVGCYPIPVSGEDVYLLRVAFPRHNFGDSFGMLLTALVGNDVSTAIRIKLIDLELVGRAIHSFSGPVQSITGLRHLINVTDRPLILNMLKPCIGYSPEDGAKLFYQAAKGGVDLIKDDELLGNTGFSDVVGRVTAYRKAAQRVTEEVGRAPVYIVNITDRPGRMRQNAQAALEAGAQAVMVNFVTAGLDALAELTAEYGSKLVFLGHYAGAGVLHSPCQGISNSVLLGKLPRLAGADAVVVMYPGSPDAPGYLEYLQTIQAHRLPFGGLKPVFSVVGGGVTPLNVASVYSDLGPDVILGVGGAIQGHPQGAAAGARAMLQAVKAAVAGTDIAVAAEACPELQKVLEIWNK